MPDYRGRPPRQVCLLGVGDGQLEDRRRIFGRMEQRAQVAELEASIDERHAHAAGAHRGRQVVGERRHPTPPLAP